MSSAESWLPDQFRPLRLLGTGGMGEVWLATETTSGNSVAVKRQRLDLPEAEASSARLRFKREFLVISKLEHPGMVRAYSLHESERSLCYTMDFVDGWPLKEYFSAGHWNGSGNGAASWPLDAEGLTRLWAVGNELLAGLEYLHRAGFVHRDLKPANVMVNREGRVKLIDFGLAKPEQQDLAITGAGEVLGTPSYLAPEQIRGLPLDGRADLYATGILLYELAAGMLPFTAKTTVEVLLAHLQQAPSPPREKNPAIVPEIGAFLLRLLAKEPAGRFVSAESARRALRAAASGEASGSAQLSATTALPVVTGIARLLAPPFIGNETALASGKAALDDLLAGRGGVLLVSAAAGLGKSRLMDELAGFGFEHGVKIWRGGARPGNNLVGQVFQDLFAQISDELLRRPERAATWLGQDGEVLAHHFPAMRRLPGLEKPALPELEPSGAQARLMGAVYGFFSRACGESRIALFAEDLHWADEQSRALLTHLVHSFTGGGSVSLAVIGNHRPDDAERSEGFDKWLGALRGDRIKSAKLAPLSDEELGRLAQAALGLHEPPDPMTAARLRTLTGGSPFFLMELLKGAIEQGTLHAGGSLREWLAVAERGALPESLDAVLSHRLSLLEEAAREALSAAAILGREFHFGVWRKMTELQEDPLLEIAERLLKGQLLEEAGNDGLRFVHDLLRQKLLSDLSGLKTRRLHAKAVKVLASEPGTAERFGEAIASHAVAAGMKEEALKFGLPAVERLILAAQFFAAENLHGTISALFDDNQQMPDVYRMEYLRLQGEIMNRRGDAKMGIEAFEIALPLALAVGDVTAEMKILRGLSVAFNRAGNQGQSLRVASQYLLRAEASGNDMEIGRACNMVALGQFKSGEVAEASKGFERAERLARSLADPQQQAELLGPIFNGWSVMAGEQGDYEFGTQLTRQALEQNEYRRNAAGVAINAGNLGEFLKHLGLLSEAEASLQKARRMNEEIGNPDGLTSNLTSLSQLALWRCDTAAALGLLDDALALTKQTGRLQHEAFAQFFIAATHQVAGKPLEALAAMTAAVQAAASMNYPAVNARVQAAAAELSLLQERLDDAQRHATAALEIAEGKFQESSALARCVSAAVRLRMGSGTGGQGSGKTHGSVADLSSPIPDPRSLTPESDLHAALDLAVTTQSVPLEFQIRLHGTTALLAAHQPEQAIEFLADTPDRAAKLGFTLFAGQAEQLLTTARKQSTR